MDKKEVLEFITKNPTAYMATVEGNKPHVRAMGTFRADEKGIIFSMQSYKDVYKQLMANPEVELCYHVGTVVVRVSGQLVPIDDLELKKQIMEKRPFYKPGVEKEGWSHVGAFIMKNAKAHVLDMKGPPTPPGTPKDWVDL
jgi:pyridoxamine 5'-phosphate oxidase